METAHPDRLEAILLLGPTGAGKTPCGEWLQDHGLWGRTCHHFDFGANLRAQVAGGPSAHFSREEIGFLQGVLAEGRLLEDQSFHLAARILDAFIRDRGVAPAHWLILNGLPRHAGQAAALEKRLQVRAVIELTCDAPTVKARLRLDPGGDRATRDDDQDELVRRKLALYVERTRPLAEYYRERGAQLISVAVSAVTLPAEITVVLEKLRPQFNRSP